MLAPPTIQPSFPDSLQCLFMPKRFKVLYGGRSAGRSWGVARALLILGRQRPIRVLCVRELQKSIEESVHKVLKDQIEKLGMGDFYEVQVSRIIGRNGTSFAFEGIKNNPAKIKSYEGIDYCWAEEAVKISKASWDILIPTIRKEEPNNWRELGMAAPDFQAEIWMTFNPELESDYTYTRWVTRDTALVACKRFLNSATGELLGNVKESPLSFVVRMTYADNPWLPAVIAQDILADKERDPDSFLHVWEGKTVQNLDGAVYAKELRRVDAEGRICPVPWEPEIPVDCFWDLGRGDRTCVWFGQYVAMQFRVIDYLEGRGEDILYYLKALQQKQYLYGTMYLPHDAKHHKLVFKHSIEKIVRDKFQNTVVLPKSGVADGINAARLFLRKCWFDEGRCADGLAWLRRYKYKIATDNGQEKTYSNEPLHDEASDAADAFRYMALAAGTPRGASAGVREKLAEAAADAVRSAKLRVAEALGGARGSNGQGWMS